MQKFKKLFTLGLLTVAVALFTPSCVEEDEPVESKVTVTVTGGVGAGAAVGGPDDNYLTTTFAAEGDLVYLFTGTPNTGMVFYRWESTPSVTITAHNANQGVYKFTMPAFDVSIRAVFEEDFVPMDGIAEIMFTWRAADQDNIFQIRTSFDDVEEYIQRYYLDDDYVAETDITNDILNNGSPLLPNNFYLGGGSPTTNKGKYFEIDAGQYTAVLEGEDQYGYVDIVANYTITTNPATANADGLDKFYELGWYVAELIEGQCTPPENDIPNDDCWDFWSTTDPEVALQQTLQKLAEKKTFLAKKQSFTQHTQSGTMNVTFYVIRRFDKRT